MLFTVILQQLLIAFQPDWTDAITSLSNTLQLVCCDKEMKDLKKKKKNLNHFRRSAECPAKHQLGYTGSPSTIFEDKLCHVASKSGSFFFLLSKIIQIQLALMGK